MTDVKGQSSKTSDVQESPQRDTEMIRINKAVLEALRMFVLEKYGKTFGYLGPEASRAIEEYVHQHRPEVKQQQQEEIAKKERRDVEENLNAIHHTLYNDYGLISKISGADLGARIWGILRKSGKKADKRTIRTYILRLMKHRKIVWIPGQGRPMAMQDEVYQII